MNKAYAISQASLSAAAALAPALLGYRALTSREQRLAALFSIRRFTGKYAFATATEKLVRSKL